MRRWIIAISVVLGVLIIIGIIGFLQSQGVIPEFKWQTLTMIFAGLAAPFQLLARSFKSSDDEYPEKVIEEQEKAKEIERKHREEVDKSIKEKELRIELLNREVQTLDSRMQILKEKQQTIEPTIKKMSDSNKKSEAQDLWGK